MHKSLASPDHMDSSAMTTEIGIGKRSAFCDLENPPDRAQFLRILNEADAYTTSCLSLEPKGFGPLRLIEYLPSRIFCDFH